MLFFAYVKKGKKKLLKLLTSKTNFEGHQFVLYSVSTQFEIATSIFCFKRTENYSVVFAVWGCGVTNLVTCLEAVATVVTSNLHSYLVVHICWLYQHVFPVESIIISSK